MPQRNPRAWSKVLAACPKALESATPPRTGWPRRCWPRAGLADPRSRSKAGTGLRRGSIATPADLMAHVARLLAPYKRPFEIIVLDTLPAASTGKILKHRLADAARDRAIERL